MNKTELYREVGRRTNIAQVDVKSVCEAMLEVIMEAVSTGESVRLQKFGNFEPRTYKERAFVHPETKERIILPPRVNPSFSATEHFKNQVRGNG